MYQRTNYGVGSSTQDVIYSDTAATTAGSTDSSFVLYTVNNIEFSFQASLSPGNTPTFGTSPGSGSVTNDTTVGTLLATISATDQDALDTLIIQWTGTTPAANAGVFSYNNNTGALTTTNQLPIGTTQLTFTATDNCGNTVTHTYSLTVKRKKKGFQMRFVA
ncbi:uncharacterized protein LOC144622635 [Crassostrea virginica]